VPRPLAFLVVTLTSPWFAPSSPICPRPLGMDVITNAMLLFFGLFNAPRLFHPPGERRTASASVLNPSYAALLPVQTPTVAPLLSPHFRASPITSQCFFLFQPATFSYRILRLPCCVRPPFSPFPKSCAVSPPADHPSSRAPRDFIPSLLFHPQELLLTTS